MFFPRQKEIGLYTKKVPNNQNMGKMRKRVEFLNLRLYPRPKDWVVVSIFFPTCQVRVVRFYVSLLFSSSFFSSFSSSSSPPSSSSSINWDPLCSVWRAGSQWQLGSSEFSVACWTPITTGILSVQCGVLDPNRDAVSSVWRAGPQLRSCEFSVACWTPTAILRVQCGVPDPNCDPASSVWRAGPQPRSCEFSVAARTPTAIL